MFQLDPIRFSTRILLLIEFTLIVLIGFAEFSIHEDVSIYVFYAVPILLAAWYTGRKAGVFVAAACVLCWFTVDLLERHYTFLILIYWNAIVRGIFFVLISMLVSGLREAYRRERELALKDYLTGLENRRAFFERANLERKRALRMRLPLAIAFLDIDEFKEINDRFGHRTGDLLLQRVASTIRMNTRDTDLVGRLGGDEFGIILVESEQGAIAALKKVHEKLNEEMRKNNWDVGFSIGICIYTDPLQPLEDMLDAADHLMYLAKESGKNTLKVQTFRFKISNSA